MTGTPTRRADSSLDPTARSCKPELRLPQHELEREGTQDEDDERDRHRADLGRDRVRDRRRDVAVRGRTQGERQPSEAYVRHECRGDWSELRESDQRSVQEADAHRREEHEDESERPDPGRLSVEHEEGPKDNEESRERADGKIDATDQQGERLPKGDEAERCAGELDRRDVEVGYVAAVALQNVGPEREHDDAEHDHRRVVALDEAQDPRPAPDPVGHSLRGVGRRADLGLDDVLFSDLLALERRDRMAARHHDHPVAETLELLRVARADDDGNVPGGDLAEDAVDLGAGADVHALRGLVGDEERGFGEHRPCHDDLLLVTA